MNDNAQIKTIPIFPQKLALYLLGEGYIVDHVEDNRHDKGRKVYHFRYAPGIFDDMNGFSERKRETAKQLYVFSRELAKSLIESGYNLIHTSLNNKGGKTYYFEKTPGLESMIKEYQKERKNARAKTEKEML